MKLFGWRWLAVSSLLVAALPATAGVRPQYGGTLRIQMHEAPASLNPAEMTEQDSFARRSLTMLIFDTLLTTDDRGRVQSGLAMSWQADPGNQRWLFRVRRGVSFHDGSPLTAENAAASLRAANPSWKVFAETGEIVVELATADSDLLAEMALPRNAIVKRNPAGVSGTGPFHIVDWQPGKKLTLAAEENCWRGRPFLDGIEIEMGKNFRDQITALELGKADLVEVAAEQAHRFAQDGPQLASSAPVELLALVFSRDAKPPEEKTLRQALALSVERRSIRSVLLQGAGQPTASILPNWMSGYAFVFPTDADLARARHDREQLRTTPGWTVGYDGSDPIARLLAERIALNVKEAGLSLQPTSAGTADLRLTRIPLASTDPWVALEDVARLAGVTVTKSKDGSIDDLYAAEQAVLATERVLPLFHLPVSFAAAPGVKDWGLRPNGSLSLADTWLESGQP